MPIIHEQCKRDLDVKIQREQDLRQKLEEQRRKMEEIMARIYQATREQISSLTDAARAKRGKGQVMSNIEAELEVQAEVVQRLDATS